MSCKLGATGPNFWNLRIWHFYHSKTISCKLGATGPNVWNLRIWHFHYSAKCHSDQRFLRYKLQKFKYFRLYDMAKWAGWDGYVKIELCGKSEELINAFLFHCTVLRQLNFGCDTMTTVKRQETFLLNPNSRPNTIPVESVKENVKAKDQTFAISRNCVDLGVANVTKSDGFEAVKPNKSG